MKILIDNQLNGMDRFLRSLDFDVTTAYDLGFTEKTDEDLIKYAKTHDMIFVTEDNKAAKLAKLHQIEHIHLDLLLKSQAVATELTKRKEKRD
jgi:predicted nuclease of predicted toxin-antitoxin system